MPRSSSKWRVVLSWAAGLAIGFGFLTLTARLSGFEGEAYLNLHILPMPAILLAMAGCLVAAMVWRRGAPGATLPHQSRREGGMTDAA